MNPSHITPASSKAVRSLAQTHTRIPHTPAKQQQSARIEATGGTLSLGVPKADTAAEVIREEAARKERHRIARELHDNLAHCLTALALQLELAEELATEGDLLVQHVRLARKFAQTAIREMRRSLQELRPGLLEKDDLKNAINRMCEGQARQLRTRAVFTGTVRRLPPNIEAALLRIAQEALTNIVRHSGAGQAQVALHYGHKSVLLTVTDDGRGFLWASRRGGFGLTSMRERAEELGGNCSVQSAAGRGTQVQAYIPIPPTI